MRRGTKPYANTVESLRAHIHARLVYWSDVYGIAYGTVAIRKQKTRWGSCSRSGNLNFNYRLAFLPPQLRDYVIVHELCHVAEHNHSPRFWVLVARAFPDYAALRSQLRRGYRF